MASFADLRPIIMIVCVVGFFAIFLGWVGSETPTFLTGVTVPEQPTRSMPQSSIAYLNGTYSYITHTNGWTDTGTVNNASINVKLYTQYALLLGVPYDYFFQVDTFDTVGLGPFSYQTNFEHFHFYTNSSKLESLSEDYSTTGLIVTSHGISMNTLDERFNGNMANLTFYMENSRTSSNVRFAYNNVTYATPQLAWAADALAVSFDAGYAQTKTADNMFQVIGALLTWNFPGVPVYIYVLVDLAFFAPALYVIAIWVLRLIGSIAGGGASG